MHVLSHQEVNQVSGSFGPLGAFIGGAIGGISQAYNGAGWQGITSGIALGALSGVTGGLAAGATGFTRAAWGVRSVASGFASGASGSTLSQTDDSSESETSDE